MKMRWLAAGITAVLITGGAATVAQRVITQKTRLVLPEKNDSAHPDSRRPADTSPIPLLSLGSSQIVGTPSEPSLIPPPGSFASGPALALPEPVVIQSSEPPRQPVNVTIAISEATPPNAQTNEADAAIIPVAPVATSEITVVEAASPEVTQPPPASIEASSKIDPVESVDTFVERNRKEAESAIQTLATEAENLKNRLAKVESALSRWQNFSRALNADQPIAQPTVGPGTKLKWYRLGPENMAQPTKRVPAEQPTEPSPNPLPSGHPPEVPTASTVPPQSEPPITTPSETKPPELPPSDQPTLPPQVQP